MSTLSGLYIELTKRWTNEDYLRDQTIFEMNLEAYGVENLPTDRGDDYYNRLQKIPRTTHDMEAQGTQFAGVVHRTIEPINIGRRRAYKIGGEV